MSVFDCSYSGIGMFDLHTIGIVYTLWGVLVVKGEDSASPQQLLLYDMTFLTYIGQ